MVYNKEKTNMEIGNYDYSMGRTYMHILYTCRIFLFKNTKARIHKHTHRQTHKYQNTDKHRKIKTLYSQIIWICKHCLGNTTCFTSDCFCLFVCLCGFVCVCMCVCLCVCVRHRCLCLFISFCCLCTPVHVPILVLFWKANWRGQDLWVDSACYGQTTLKSGQECRWRTAPEQRKIDNNGRS